VNASIIVGAGTGIVFYINAHYIGVPDPVHPSFPRVELLLKYKQK